MIGTALIVAMIVLVGSHVADGLRLRQQEIILHALPEDEARVYYELIRRRVLRQRILRAIAMLSLVAIVYAYKSRLARSGPPKIAWTTCATHLCADASSSRSSLPAAAFPTRA